MSLDKWLEKSGCYCQDVNGAKLVFLGRVGTSKSARGTAADLVSGLWGLVDFAVSSVSGERVWLVARRAA
jgi:hypothetical protein